MMMTELMPCRQPTVSLPFRQSAWASEVPCYPFPSEYSDTSPITSHALPSPLQAAYTQSLFALCNHPPKKPSRASELSEYATLSNTEQPHVLAVPCGLHCLTSQEIGSAELALCCWGSCHLVTTHSHASAACKMCDVFDFAQPQKAHAGLNQ
jgi:hypothetical protein